MPVLGKTLFKPVLTRQFSFKTLETVAFWIIKNIDKMFKIIWETLLVEI
jgi:hypothetical protein